jgi:hypothetical protein
MSGSKSGFHRKVYHRKGKLDQLGSLVRAGNMHIIGDGRCGFLSRLFWVVCKFKPTLTRAVKMRNVQKSKERFIHLGLEPNRGDALSHLREFS